MNNNNNEQNINEGVLVPYYSREVLEVDNTDIVSCDSRDLEVELLGENELRFAVHPDQEVISKWILDINNSNVNGCPEDEISIYDASEINNELFKDSKIWGKVNESKDFLKSIKQYHASLPNVGDINSLINPINDKVTPEGYNACVSICNSTKITSNCLIDNAFKVTTGLEENYLPFLKKTFRYIRFWGQGQDQLEMQTRVFQVINFIIYGAPAVLVISTTGGSESLEILNIGFQSVGQSLYDKCCTYEHYSNLSYLARMQNNLSDIALVQTAVDIINNPQLLTDLALNEGKKLSKYLIKYYLVKPLCYERQWLLPFLTNNATLFLLEGGLSGNDPQVVNTNIVQTNVNPNPITENQIVRFGIPQMHPR